MKSEESQPVLGDASHPELSEATAAGLLLAVQVGRVREYAAGMNMIEPTGASAALPDVVEWHADAVAEGNADGVAEWHVDGVAERNGSTDLVDSADLIAENAQGQEGAQPALWRSGFVKEAVVGAVRLELTQLVGDEQADLKHHGGPDKAVLAYAQSHYETWQAELHDRLPPELVENGLPFGAFGENFTIAGINESTVCIGDVYEIGSALVQVAQPRIPCWKVSKRWGIENLRDFVVDTGRTGWYLRVLREGIVQAGDRLTLVEREYPTLTIALANDLLHGRRTDAQLLQSLAMCPALAVSWKAMLKRPLEE